MARKRKTKPLNELTLRQLLNRLNPTIAKALQVFFSPNGPCEWRTYKILATALKKFNAEAKWRQTTKPVAERDALVSALKPYNALLAEAPEVLSQILQILAEIDNRVQLIKAKADITTWT